MRRVSGAIQWCQTFTSSLWAPFAVAIRPMLDRAARTGCPRYGHRAHPPPAEDRPARPPRRVAADRDADRARAGARVELPCRHARRACASLVFRERYRHLGEYLEGFRYTVAVLSDAEALERVAYELCEDNFAEGVRYLEVRFAPQLHVRAGLRGAATWCARSTAGLRRATDDAQSQRRRLRRARSRRSARGSSCARCASSRRSSPRATAATSTPLPARPSEEVYAAASLVARARGRAPQARRRASSSASTSPGRSTGYPAERPPRRLPGRARGLPRQDRARGRGLRPGVHLPGDHRLPRRPHRPRHLALRRDASPRRRGHRGPDRYVDELAQYIADKRITIEVCLTSNQQTVPELAADLKLHPFGADAGAAPARRRSARTTGSSRTRP